MISRQATTNFFSHYFSPYLLIKVIITIILFFCFFNEISILFIIRLRNAHVSLIDCNAANLTYLNDVSSSDCQFFLSVISLRPSIKVIITIILFFPFVFLNEISILFIIRLCNTYASLRRAVDRW